MFERALARAATGSLLIALGVAACSGSHLTNGGDDQAAGSGGDGGGSGVAEGTETPAPGAQGGDGGASGGSAASAIGDGGLGGAGAANQAAEEEATVALEATVAAALDGSAVVTDVSTLEGRTFQLRDCIGPYELTMSWDSEEQSDPHYYPQLRFCPKLTLHFIADDDGLALVAEQPTETFPYAERLKLERRGNAWLAKGLATSNRLFLRNEDEKWATDFYRAALTVFAFPDHDQDGKPDGLITAATNSDDGLFTLENGDPLLGYDEDLRMGWIKWGNAQGVSLSRGLPAGFPTIGAAELVLPGVVMLHTPLFSSTGFLHDQELWFRLPVLTLTSPVLSDSAFYFENAQGERSTTQLIPGSSLVGAASYRYIQGIVPVEDLTGDWDLVGEGTQLNGEPFELRQPITLLDNGGGGAAGVDGQ